MSLLPVRLYCALFVAAGLCGQEPVPPEAAEPLVRLFQPYPEERPLSCEVRPIPPALTFRLIYRAGYFVTVSMEQLMEEPRAVAVLTRITPQRSGSRPLLLKETAALPEEASEQERDASKFEAQLRGGFYLGEGKYRVELAVVGSGQRVCRKQWDIEVKPRKGVQASLPPGEVAARSHIDLPRLGRRAGSATILLHAGAPQGNPVLLQSVAAILDRMPFGRVQVVVFRLDQHKELARQEVTGAADFGRIAEVLNAHNPATVSYGVLQDPAGHRDFLWKLLAKQGLRSPPDDVVIFLGFATLDDSHVFVPPACTDGSPKPAYIYLDYAAVSQARMRRMPGARRQRSDAWTDLPQTAAQRPLMQDAITRITRACSGKVFGIYSPSDLASALEKTDDLLSGR